MKNSKFINLTIMLIIIISIAASSTHIVLATAEPVHFPVAKPNCLDRCGNVSIPFPFGTTEGCYYDYNYFVTCNHSLKYSPKLHIKNISSMEILDISLDGQLRIMQFIAHDCYDRNRSISSTVPSISFSTFTVNNTANKFTIVGCDSYGYVSGWRDSYAFGKVRNRKYSTGCIATCNSMDDVADSTNCTGLGCCQTSIPKQVWRVEIELRSFNNFSDVSNFNNCSYAFVAEESAFRFSADNLTNLRKVTELPFVAEAQMNSSSYACVSPSSECYKPDNGNGYRCRCLKGYQGNPYLSHGCRDINECEDPKVNNCEMQCENTPGSFRCVCPKGYEKKGSQGCIPGESLTYKLVAGISLGMVVLLLAACWLYLELKRRRLASMKQKFFLQNGGVLLQDKLMKGRERSQPDNTTTKIFTSLEMDKATKNFHDSMIIGQGGYGTVYKGLLQHDNNKTVAIKKAKQIDPTQIEQFINEVIVLSQINHRNVVRLLGCCLDTQVPLLVYEFINNGTLFEHIHDPAKARFLSWDVRLRIAAETAGVLSYLHSSASTPIIHRDVKSANILLDHNFTAKVSDFGSSRLVPLDQTQLSTMVQGTFGYLDPEYMQTNQLTEKSDVYSFGVVLVELLTGRKALSYDKPEEERNLSNFFLSMFKQEHLFEILDDNIVCEGNGDKLVEVARLAKACLSVRGEDRPTMKQVAMELEGLRISGKHSWALANEGKNGDEEMEYLLGENSNMINFVANGSYGDTTTSIGYDSLRIHVISPMTGGR